MKILIVGTGIIGTIYGWALSQAGFDVDHFVRKEKMVDNNKIVTIDILDERKNHKKNNVTSYTLQCIDFVPNEEKYDYVLVPTNSYQVIEVLNTLYQQSSSSFFLIMASNWIGLEEIDKILPKYQYALAYPDGGGTIKDGAYWTNIGSELHIETGYPENKQQIKNLELIFQKVDIQFDYQENMLHWLWLHMAMSVPMWVSFLQYKDMKKYLKAKKSVKDAFYASKEVIRLCEIRGVDISKYPETSSFRLPFRLFFIIFKLLYRFNKSMQRYTAHAAYSVEEVKINYNEIMQSASELAVEMPIMKSFESVIS